MNIDFNYSKFLTAAISLLWLSACGGGSGGNDGNSAAIDPDLVLVPDTSDSRFGTLVLSEFGTDTTFTPLYGDSSASDTGNGLLIFVWTDSITGGTSLSGGILDNYLGQTWKDITLSFAFGGVYSCKSGEIGTEGRCESITYDFGSRIIYFDEAELIGPAGRSLVVNGALYY